MTGDRNSAPAVVAAWNHFYDNTGGIRDEFAAAWGAVAERFAGRPDVAGYDILNEPEVSRPAADLTPLYDTVLADSIAAIRAAESGAAFEHLVVVEPAIPAGDTSLGIVVPDLERIGEPTNVVAGPHNYAESIIDGITIEQMNDLFLLIADDIGVPLWIGEYGFWHRGEATLDRIDRYAADEDANVLGGAWWQWRQGCGDPHSIGWGELATGEVTHHNVVRCPGDVDLGPNEQFLAVLGRAYPGAAPGCTTELESAYETGRLRLAAADSPAGARLILWTPTSARTHRIDATGVHHVRSRRVPGGRIVTATTTASEYALVIEPRGHSTRPSQ